MPTRSKDKGTWAETQILRAAQANGFPDAYRLALHGAADVGDIQLCKRIIIEAKNEKAISVPQYLRELEVEMINSKSVFGFVCYKTPGLGEQNVLQWPTVVRAGDLLPFLTTHFPQDGYPPVVWTSKAAWGKPNEFNLREVTMSLNHMFILLKAAGYGSEEVCSD